MSRDHHVFGLPRPRGRWLVGCVGCSVTPRIVVGAAAVEAWRVEHCEAPR